MLAACIFEQTIRDVPLDILKLPYAIELGWRSYKTCPTTISKEERKRGVWKSFVGCMNENNNMMVGLCQAITEMTLGN